VQRFLIQGMHIDQWNTGGSGAQAIVLKDGSDGVITNNIFGTAAVGGSYAIKLDSASTVGPSNLLITANDMLLPALRILQTYVGTNVRIFNNPGNSDFVLDKLDDVTISSPSNGQVLKYNGSAWINDTDSTGSGGIGRGCGCSDPRDHQLYRRSSGGRRRQRK
jgi:hypothetical protein